MVQITESVRVTIDSGEIAGFVDRHAPQARSTAGEPKGDRAPLKKFLGIPYAQAGRWEQSRPPQPWSEPRECTEFGPIPPQTISLVSSYYIGKPGLIDRSHLGESEDCLTANVFAPEGVEGPLPVLVWIYGGSFTTGSSSLGLYDPSEWIRRSTRDGRPFIVVTGNHRLNAFGFISHPDLVETDPDGLGGNYGLRDNLQLLEWTQRNAKAFGGDPTRVTAFGESAGSIQLAILCHSGRKLFKRAVLESGAASTSPLRPVEQAQQPWDELLEHFSIKGETAKERVDAMKKISTKEIMDFITPNSKLGKWAMVLEKGPKAIWSTDPTSQLIAGKINEGVEAVIAGTMQDEGTLFVKAAKNRLSVATWTAQYPESVRPALSKLYPESSEDSLARAFGDSLFDGPNAHQTRHLSALVPTYAYRIETLPSVLKDEELGNWHAAELAFVWNRSGMWHEDENSADGKTSRAIGDAWVKFAYGEEPWQRFGDDEHVLVFKDGGQTVDSSLKTHKTPQLDFWSKLIAHRAQSS